MKTYQVKGWVLEQAICVWVEAQDREYIIPVSSKVFWSIGA